ncbi:MAG: anthranilate synthase component I family protein [Candidatus Altimarinota bacterium]
MNYELSTINHLSPLEVFLRIPKEAKHLACLFSDGSADSRWSILAWDPVETVRGNGQWSMVNGQTIHQSIGIVLREKLKNRKQTRTKTLPFVGGAIGALDYEYGYELLGLPYPPKRGSLVEFSFYDQALIYDHHQNQWWGVNMSAGRDAINRVSTAFTHPVLNLEPVWDFEEYKKSFDFIHENIRKGEIYQACLTFPFIGKPVDDPRVLFYSLAKKKAAPMAAYLEQSDRTIMSLSPERFISWDGENLETKPIKGTRPRGATPEEDERLKQELLADEKEQAELCMITDLLRNDLARVSKAGTVQVLDHQALQATPSVWHTFSRIRSQTKAGVGAWDILESMFPGGSISGCPKKRAVELLAEVEPHPRGIYTGCIGYISDQGTMDMSIAIRTLEQTAHEIRAGFGSGIVYDSQAAAEYQECFDKARVFQSPGSVSTDISMHGLKPTF